MVCSRTVRPNIPALSSVAQRDMSSDAWNRPSGGNDDDVAGIADGECGNRCAGRAPSSAADPTPACDSLLNSESQSTDKSEGRRLKIRLRMSPSH